MERLSAQRDKQERRRTGTDQIMRLQLHRSQQQRVVQIRQSASVAGLQIKRFRGRVKRENAVRIPGNLGIRTESHIHIRSAPDPVSAAGKWE